MYLLLARHSHTRTNKPDFYLTKPNSKNIYKLPSMSSQWKTVAAAAGCALASAVAMYLIKKSKEDKSVVVTLPAWLEEYEASFKGQEFTSDEEMMAVAVEISARNVNLKTGGPFGTAIYEREKATGKSTLLAVGANLVVPSHNSTLHGEMTAIQFAEKKLQNYSLSATAEHEYILCTSCEPCCMCLGGTLWSGVAEMMCSGTKADAEIIGFNEGPVFPESYKALEASGMRIKRKVLHAQGAAVLKKYGETGVIY